MAKLLSITEQENPRTKNLSSAPVAEILRLMNEEDALVAAAVTAVLPDVALAVEESLVRLKNDGRIFYIGTGTSGRLGVLDASECPPTFGVSPDLVQAIIAGGYDACYRAVEASEDDEAAGARDLDSRGFTAKDVLVGIAASGRTPYTLGALFAARELGALTISIACSPGSPITSIAEINIVPVVGPEVLAGSTRLKAGTAQKMVLNMLSTAILTKLGYVSGNRMTNLSPRNAKLHDRAIRILMAEAGLDEVDANDLLGKAGNDMRVALVMNKANCNLDQARKALESERGVVQKAVESLRDRS